VDLRGLCGEVGFKAANHPVLVHNGEHEFLFSEQALAEQGFRFSENFKKLPKSALLAF
jgi:hypothetical protein